MLPHVGEGGNSSPPTGEGMLDNDNDNANDNDNDNDNDNANANDNDNDNDNDNEGIPLWPPASPPGERSPPWKSQWKFQ